MSEGYEVTFELPGRPASGVVGKRIDWMLKVEGGGMTIPLLQYVARFDGGGEIVGFGGGGDNKSRPRCSLFVSSPSRGDVAVCTRICSQEYVHEKKKRGGLHAVVP